MKRAIRYLRFSQLGQSNSSIERQELYTEKAKEGRYVYRAAPFGYRKQGENKNRHLVIEEKETDIVRFVYQSFLENVPLCLIKQQARQLGFDRKGHTAIERVLTNPTY